MGWCPGQPRVGLFEGDAGGVWPPRSLSPPTAQFLRLGWRWLSISAGAPAPRSLVRDRPGGLSQGAGNSQLRQGASQVAQGKEFACQARDAGSIPTWGRSSGEGNGNPLQYSYLENAMDGEVW